jgi:proteasome assembly chaperone (PAC2) family protein
VAAPPAVRAFEDLDALALREPRALITFGGWIDAGQASTGAVTYLADQLAARRVAELEPELFYAFSDTRPATRLAEIGPVLVKWPRAELLVARMPEGVAHDLILFSAPEPNLRWRGFSETLVGLLQRLGVRLLISIGTVLAPIHYRAAIPLRGWATTPTTRAALRRRRIIPSDYEGPTGIATALLATAQDRGLPAIGLTGLTPSYLSGLPHPRASVTLLRTVSALSGVPLPLTDLEKTIGEVDERIERFLDEQPELREQVEELERPSDPDPPEAERQPGPPPSPGELPSADAVLRDLEDYLRGMRPDQDEPEPGTA